MYHPSKHRTLNNITNIEDLALNFKTPEDILIESEEDDWFEKLLGDVVKLGNLNQIDILVLGGEKTRKQAAKELGIKYSTYQKQLYRKILKIRKQKLDK